MDDWAITPLIGPPAELPDQPKSLHMPKNDPGLTFGDNGENTPGILIKELSEDIDSINTSSGIDLVDDQTFPFIPGFGENSSKY